MRIGLPFICCMMLALTGCSDGVPGGVGSARSQVAGGAGARLTGLVKGGQQPISGARVYLLAAASGAVGSGNGTGAAAYGGAGIAASASNASVSLLTSAGNTALDSSGGATNGDYFVTTDGSGNFSITGDYTCSAGQQVYLYILGGDPGVGSGVNAAAGLMAALGNCPVAGNFLATTPYIVVNEVSTVAAGYAMAGFATDATHVGSSGTPLALTGIANAFANVGNLETLGTGVALATTPAGNGTVPQAEINTLANVLAACVNSSGAGSSGCSTLFANAESAGSTGTVVSDTATAAINIAHNPGANVAALYGLTVANPPFAGGLSAVPNDWTVAVTLSGGGLNQPEYLAVDGAGDVWVSNYGNGNGNSSVTELSSAGAILSEVGGYTNGGISQVKGIAIDAGGNAWLANGIVPKPFGTFPLTTVVKLNSSGVASSGSPYTPVSNNGPVEPSGIAIDGAGNAWVGSYQFSGGFGSVTEISSGNNSYTGPYSSQCMNLPDGMAVDASGDVWIGAEGSICEFSNGGVNLSGSSGFGAGNGPYDSIAIDASGNVWAAGQTAVVKVGQNGTTLSGLGYTSGGISGAGGISIDGAGNAWIADSNGTVSELSSVGVAISPSTGYSVNSGKNSTAIAVDGAGNVWVAGTQTSSGNAGTTVVELVGAGTPAVTPLAVGVKNNTLGTRP